MRRLIVKVSLIVAFLVVDAANGADYWPAANGDVYTYQYDSGERFSVAFKSDGAYTTWENRVDKEREQFSVDGEGDTVLSFYGIYCAGWTDPDFWSYEPAIKFLDLPLEVGKQWSTLSTTHGYATGWDIVMFEVVSSTNVTVPYGTFAVFEVRESSLMGTRPYETYFVNEAVGPVICKGGAKLVTVTGATPISCASWGSVKALFR